MSSPDLPTELWLEILSYLPPHYILSLVGVNRILFELALDYKYREVQLIEDDKETRRWFKALCGGAGNRVKRLYVRPSFLPGMCSGEWEGELLEEGDVPTSFAWVKTLLPARPSAQAPNINTSGLFDFPDSVTKLLKAASLSLHRCPNIQEITIVLYDHHITHLFASFLNSIWENLGDRLKKLCVQTTLAKIPTILGGISLLTATGTTGGGLRNLEVFDLLITNSRFPVTQSTTKAATTAIVDFVSTFKDTLTHISLSSIVEYDLTPLFQSLSTLDDPPKLTKFELWLILCPVTLSRPSALSKFLQSTSSTLTHLVLHPIPKFGIEVFFPHREQMKGFIGSADFSNLSLPFVRRLEIGMKVDWGMNYPGGYRLGPTFPSLVRPRDGAKIGNGGIFTNLRALKFKTSTSLTFREMEVLLQGSAGCLAELDVWVTTFNSELHQLLAREAPTLEKLYLVYTTSPLCGLTIDAADSRLYPQWKLKWVRIGNRGDCGEIHPHRFISRVVARSASTSTVEIDGEYLCFCYRESSWAGLLGRSDSL
ncbi:hypothetical protein FA15DRAFT_668044 [Coprinopsis marcescibilis]|uniref:F-box domain-containing protein n=1 Tax=Coprinopsis marcescibilis TaxID=230819 RepID=A0A5C3KZY2_COPMA|nr:hypothetical protein FA15DRAFT_668044 [Coprinopsis marcescibilis]